MLWIAWALVLLGLVYLVSEASIALPVRVPLAKLHGMLEALIYCPTCVSFWVGMLLALAGVNPFEVLEPQAAWAHFIYAGLGAMGLTATWSAWRGGNPAWAIEAPLRGQHGTTEESDGQ